MDRVFGARSHVCDAPLGRYAPRGGARSDADDLRVSVFQASGDNTLAAAQMRVFCSILELLNPAGYGVSETIILFIANGKRDALS
ncbi:hypothetical protein GGD57_001606 [Rhizobium esperanzae]|uniref:Uncharacterized protein n=1 Tax=Rhizobium esperanzae TaxID=1967781 RepID=A0A7W6W443_9HYPH|nr:hypothetical protein [Rhizobium esperanzae]